MKRCFCNIFIYFCFFTSQLSCGSVLKGVLHTPHLIKGREAENGSSVCKQDNGQFSDPEYCDKYYDCWEGKPVSSGQCNHGLMFNEQTGSCDYPANVNCEGKEVAQPPQHLDEGCEQAYGTFSSPRHCSEYTVCHAGIASYFKCDEGLAFDKESSSCASPHNPLCLETNLPNDRPEGEGIAEIPLDPDTIKPAPPSGPAGGGNGDGQFPAPDWPKYANCPTDATGFYPVAKNCQSVVVCIRGEGFLLNCPQGHYYYPREARCKAGGINSCEQMQIETAYVRKPSANSASSTSRNAYFKVSYPLLPF